MRILDNASDRASQAVTLYLTRPEAQELRDSLDALLADESGRRHEHVMDDDYRKEITVCLYDEADLGHFDARSQRLIIEDS